MTTPKRVLLADDSELFTDVLAELLEAEADLKLVGTVNDGRKAVEAVKRLRPDVVVMDVLMPELDGLGATEAIMAEQPTPILVLSADPRSRTGELSLEALARGALDVMPKPEGYPFSQAERRRLVERIRFLSNVAVVRHVRGRRRRWKPSAPSVARVERPTPTPKAPRPVAPVAVAPSGKSAERFVVLAASTGGPQALAGILRKLDVSLNASVIIVQHMSPSFVPALCRWLDGESPLPVAVASKGGVPEAGRVWLAPSGHHLVVASRRFDLRPGDEALHCPSADRLFASMARDEARRTLGVVLTGMGTDGAAGLLALRTAGARTLVQDADSSVVDGMPRAARACGAAERVLPLDRIAEAIIEWAGERPP